MDPPPAETATKRKRSPARLAVWLIALGALFGISELGLFEDKPGPDPAEVEQAISDNAADYGVTITVDCPDDAEETEVEASFLCSVTTDDGDSFRIRVTNHEDNFSWPSGRIAALA